MGKATTTTFHPLDQLSPAELGTATICVRAFIFENFKTKTSIKYAYVTLIEPPKVRTNPIPALPRPPSLNSETRGAEKKK
jgi:Cu2+-containing amine oxidase